MVPGAFQYEHHAFVFFLSDYLPKFGKTNVSKKTYKRKRFSIFFKWQAFHFMQYFVLLKCSTRIPNMAVC